MDELRNKIEEREARLAVIGLGYVGLPVTCQFASAGFDVLGVDIRNERIDQIRKCISPIGSSEP
ncbi:MAG: 3-hydroxyacyl-CoA dehydrogenase NAD-binding domain-containing protein, partial [Anaerolineales bacterium]